MHYPVSTQQATTPPPLDDDVPVFSLEQNTTRNELKGLKTLRLFCNDEADTNALRKSDVPRCQRDDEPIRFDTLKKEQGTDPDCISYQSKIGTQGCKFIVNDDGVLVRKTFDRNQQVVVPKSLRQRVLYLAHETVTSGHVGVTKMYDTLRRQLYWTSMYNR